MCPTDANSQRGLEAQTLIVPNHSQHKDETKKSIKSMIGSQFSSQVSYASMAIYGV